MSYAAVQTALVNRLTVAGITGVTRVYGAAPKIIDERDIIEPQQLSGAVLIVYIGGHAAHRIALGGAHGGIKQADYDVEIQVLFKSFEPKSEDAVTTFYGILDALLALIRADRTLADPTNVVWEVAEGPTGERVRVDPPLLYSDTTEVFATVSVVVTEMVNT